MLRRAPTKDARARTGTMMQSKDAVAIDVVSRSCFAKRMEIISLKGPTVELAHFIVMMRHCVSL